jgi:predicted component of type VI protein secretion system
VRYHQALVGNEDWSERLLTKDFARTYEEQVSPDRFAQSRPARITP